MSEQFQRVVSSIPPHHRISLPEMMTAARTNSFINEFVALHGPGGNDILCLINSGGGQYDAGVKIAKLFVKSPMRVIGLVIGKAESAAFMVLQACALRFAAPDAKFRIHAPQAFAIDTPITYNGTEEDYIEGQRKEFRHYQPLLMQGRSDTLSTLSAKSTLAKLELEEFLRKEEPFGVDEALRMGFLDHAAVST